ncbi:hypothetical protein NL676_017431 [Syzygium grande]|nr:hypothetical protein NL676_017431 [Syzygium grande]
MSIISTAKLGLSPSNLVELHRFVDDAKYGQELDAAVAESGQRKERDTFTERRPIYCRPGWTMASVEVGDGLDDCPGMVERTVSWVRVWVHLRYRL